MLPDPERAAGCACVGGVCELGGGAEGKGGGRKGEVAVEHRRKGPAW